MQGTRCRKREHPRQSRLRRRGVAELDQRLSRNGRPWVRRAPIPHGEGDPSPGPQHAPHLAGRRLRIGEQHQAPAAQNRVDAGRRQVDPLELEPEELDVLDTHALGAVAGDLEHRLARVAAHEHAGRIDELGGEQAGVARAGRQFEHALARLQPELLDHPDRDRHPVLADLLGALAPAGGGALPALVLL